MNVKKSIAKYILTECLEVSLVEFFERFQVEYEHPYHLKLFPNRMVRLSEYLAGLPSTINIPCYYFEIRELVLKFEPEVSERTLKRWENNFFMIVADILLTEYEASFEAKFDKLVKIVLDDDMFKYEGSVRVSRGVSNKLDTFSLQFISLRNLSFEISREFYYDFIMKSKYYKNRFNKLKALKYN